MDPRVKTPLSALQQQFDLSKQIFDALARSADALRGRTGAAGSVESDLARVTTELLGLFNLLQDGDVAATARPSPQLPGGCVPTLHYWHEFAEAR